MRELAISLWRLLCSVASLGLLIVAIVYAVRGDYQKATWAMSLVILSEIQRRNND